CSFFFSSRRRHTRWPRDWSSDVCSSDLLIPPKETLFRIAEGIKDIRDPLSVVARPIRKRATWNRGCQLTCGTKRDRTAARSRKGLPKPGLARGAKKISRGSLLQRKGGRTTNTFLLAP